MSNLSIPFNLDLLVLDNVKIYGMKPVKTLDVFDGSTKNFHEDGLFSPSIFGRLGEERRMRLYSYIDIRLPIMHPLIYNTLGELKRLYHDIMNGKEYARWDPQIKDFVKSDQLDGKTGYQFFLDHWTQIQFESRDSDKRDTKVRLVKKYQAKTLNTRIVVIPAGLRDYEIQDDGRESENEINDLYRRFLSISRNIPLNALKGPLDPYDLTRARLQATFVELYELFKRYTEGKKKLLMGKWARRGIHNGTRNVITTTNIRANELGSPANIQYNDTVVGLFQYMKATLPVSKYQIKNTYLPQIFTGPNAPAFLIDKKTLKRTPVTVNSQHFDAWMTDEGLDGVINRFGEPLLRHRQLEIEGHYMALVYKPPGQFKVFFDIDDLPEGANRDLVTPITFIELLYLSVYAHSRKYPAIFTRYPVTGFGSIYPSTVFLRTTMQVQQRAPLGDHWQVDSSLPIAYQFPTDTETFNTVSPSPARLAGLGADFDGDTGSFTVLYSEEARAENKKFFGNKNFYVGTDGKIAASVAVDTVNYLMQNMTGDPVVPGMELYSESRKSTATSTGKRYSLNKLFKATENEPVVDFKTADLVWVLEYTETIRERVESADLNDPILVYKDPKWGLVVLDGAHRLVKAVQEKRKTMKGYLLTDKMLKAAYLGESPATEGQVARLHVFAGQYYDWAKLQALAAKLKPEPVEVDAIEWSLNHQSPENTSEIRLGFQQGEVDLRDVERVQNADYSEPIWVINTKDHGLMVLDGYHRLKKAIDQHEKTVPAIMITQDLLDQARP